MAVTWQTEAHAGNKAVASLTISKPSGVVDGDLMVAFIGCTGSAVTITPPAGWTAIRNDTDTSTINERSFWKIASSEGASYDFTFSASTNCLGSIHRITGHDATTPIDASGGQTNASSLSVTAPTITTATANTLLLFASVITSNGGGSATSTAPGGMTEVADFDNNGFGNLNSEICREAIAAIGATGTRVATASQNVTSAAQLVAIKAAAAAGTNAARRTTVGAG